MSSNILLLSIRKIMSQICVSQTAYHLTAIQPSAHRPLPDADSRAGRSRRDQRGVHCAQSRRRGRRHGAARRRGAAGATGRGQRRSEVQRCVHTNTRTLTKWLGIGHRVKRSQYHERPAQWSNHCQIATQSFLKSSKSSISGFCF